MIGRHGRWFVPLGPWTCRWKKIKHVDHATALLDRSCHTCVSTSGVPVGISGHVFQGYQLGGVQDTNGAGDEVDSLTILGCRRWVDGGWRGGARGRGRERRAGGRENTAVKTYVVVVVVWVGGVWVAGSMILGVVVRLLL